MSSTTPRDNVPQTSGGDWMRGVEKRTGNQERRPQVQRASDLLGPGFAPYAVPLGDWNSLSAHLNGMWYADDALNAPGAGTYLGITVAAIGGDAVQLALGTTTVHLRRVSLTGVETPVYTAWEQIVPVVSNSPGSMIGWPTGAAVPTGYVAATGATVARSAYPGLADALSVPAGAETFALPRVPDSGDMRTIVKT